MKDCITDVDYLFYVKDLSTLDAHNASLNQKHVNTTIIYLNNKQLKKVSNDVKK
jgi:hypothetical protein